MSIINKIYLGVEKSMIGTYIVHLPIRFFCVKVILHIHLPLHVYNMYIYIIYINQVRVFSDPLYVL